MATPVTIHTDDLPVLALVGRVNVGKSTLFNRLIEERKAMVSPIAGTTRTNNEGVIIWRGVMLKVIDTGGLSFSDAVPLEKDILAQSARAVKEADIIVFVTDGQIGILPQERQLAKWLHTTCTKPVMVVANKIDSIKIQKKVMLDDWKALGFGMPHVLSASNGKYVGDFLEAVFSQLHKGKRRPKTIKDKPVKPIRISVIGKPNVGKSSLFNKLIGEDRVIVSPMAHTTREPHDTLVMYEDERVSTDAAGKAVKKSPQPLLFVDTAGIRRKAQVSGDLERQGIQKSIKSIEISDIVLFVLDGSEPISSQDRQLGGLLEKRVKSVIILINKWDLAKDVTDKIRNDVKAMVYGNFPHIDFAPIVFVSGLTGYRTHTIFPLIMDIWEARHTQVAEEDLRHFLRTVTVDHHPTIDKGSRPPEIMAMMQEDVNPPVFQMLIKYRTSVHISYVHYIERRLREKFNFLGTPVMIKLKKMKR